MSHPKEVNTILLENELRMAERRRMFNPLTGFGSTGERFTLDVGDMELLRLPVSMRSERLVRELLRAKSVNALLEGRLGRDPIVRDRELFDEEFDRVRMRHDFAYWAATRAYIKNKGGGEDILFRLNAPQRRLVERFEAMRLANRPIRLILLKARQWGGSTCSQLYMAWLQLVHSAGLNSLIIAHQGVGSDEIKDMFDRMIGQYPLTLLHEEPDYEPDSREKRVEWVGKSRSMFRVPARNCKVKVGSAERPDSCRGGDYSLVHCSEVGVWKRTQGKTPEQILRSACSGVLLKPMTMIVYESTANGTGNFFHREYEAARRGESQFESMFVSWYEIDQYSIELTEPEKEELALRLWEGRGAATSVSEREQPGEYLWWLWERGATLEAIAWYISERSKYSDHGLMASEYPSDDVEAFVHSGARVFDKYKVEALRGDCRRAEYCGDIDAPGPQGHDSRHITDEMRRQLLRDVRFQPLQSGEWEIWRLPDEEGPRFADRYVAVVDVGGRSHKSDWSVIAVFDRSPMSSGGRPEVVAQWRGHTDFDLLAWRAAMAASFYHDALLVVESNTLETRDPNRDTDGDQSNFILNRLRDVYPNLYARRRNEEEVRLGVPSRYGFHTNVSTKPMIIATLVKVIRDGLYVERDERTLDEYLTYERRQNGSYGAIAGSHDDLLMTRAIGLHIIFHELDAPAAAPEAGLPRVGVKVAGGRRRGSFAAW